MITNSDDGMQQDNSPATEPAGVSRRALLGAAALAGGAGLVGLVPSIPTSAARGFPEDLAPALPGLAYITLDAFAFDVAGVDKFRLYQDLTGMEPFPTDDFINAPLPLPIGSVIRQINVGYQGQPDISVARRTLAGDLTDLVAATTLAAGGGPKTQTLSVNAELTEGASYTVRAFCSTADSVFGMTIGYIPPPQAFVPFIGPDPRVLDTRPAGLVAPHSEIVVDLSSLLVPTARAAVFNLTATETGGPGFLAAFPDGITWPGNSSLNFTSAGATVANGVISEVSDGKIRVRTGPASSHVIVDVIGSLL